MNNQGFVSIERASRLRAKREATKSILLIKAPYFTPWTPPLGIASLKSFIQQQGYSARCVDFNIDPELWAMHHNYFATLQKLESVSINDGYSKLWWILNSHMMAYANGADRAGCALVVETIAPMYGLTLNCDTVNAALSLVEKFFARLDHLIDGLDLDNYSAIGTSTYTTSLAASLFILKRVKQKRPRIKTLMGGGVFADDLALGSDNLETLIREYDFVDHIILGEGELLLLKLLEGEFADKRVISIADLNGTTLSMKDVPLPDFTDLDIDNYFHLTIEGARSCPFQCSFCSETIQWGDYRKKPVETFAQQVIALSQRHDNNSFFMGDSLMNPYIIQFADELTKRNAEIFYDGYLRADKPVMNRSKVKLWARSGCFRVRLGIESASASVLNTMDKMTSPKVISEVLKSLASAGIRTTTYWIVGFPGETEEDFQETLDFIIEHHRYIYELEAHPYYYYPYGQVGSRLYTCHSLYPEEVTDITKFKVWEADGISPGRMERFERLRRISKLASDLGLPNIYTMAERFEAEDRWHRLYPLATEVYEDTGLHREQARPGRQRLGVYSNEAGWTETVLAYQVSVSKPLNKDVLAASVARLIDFNEVLQMSLSDGHYVPADVPNNFTQQELVYEYNFDGGPDQLDGIKADILEKAATQMRPERGASVRVALASNSQGHSEVFLLAHKAIADARSAVLLLEDLFRIYEQLSNDRDISLCPIEKSYSAFVLDHNDPARLGNVITLHGQNFEADLRGPVDGLSGEQGHLEGMPVNSLDIELDKPVADQIFATRLVGSGWRPHEVFIVTLLTSLESAATGDVGLDIREDCRATDQSLGETVGVLTRIKRVTSSAIFDRLFKPGNGQARLSPANAPQRRVLIDLGFLTDEPWLGGDEWTPAGFVFREAALNPAHLVEFTPVRSRDGVKICLKYRDTAEARALVAAIEDHLVDDLKSLLESPAEWVDLKRIWLREFGHKAPTPDEEPGLFSETLAEENTPLIIPEVQQLEPKPFGHRKD
jgi:radical SAM superfamily enzyme YgiQ (UPF0313 family)